MLCLLMFGTGCSTPCPALHTPLLSQIPALQPPGIFLGAVDRDNVCWGPADGDKSLLPTSPRPVGSAGNLGDNWPDFFIPDGWKVLARMENNLSGVGILLAGAFWIKQSLCREVAEPQWPLQDLGLNFGSQEVTGSCAGFCSSIRTHGFGQLGKEEHQSSSLFPWA